MRIRLFREVPVMLDKALSDLKEYRLDEDKCEVLAYACHALDEWAEYNEIDSDENVSAEIEGDTSVVIRVLANSFVIENGKDDLMYKAVCRADSGSFKYVNCDVVMFEERFDNIFVSK